MPYSWIKARLDMLEDYQLHGLPDRLWRRNMEINLAAARYGQNGQLPPVAELAFWLRLAVDALTADLRELAEAGLVELRSDGWHVLGYADRQSAAPVAERVAQYRRRNTSGNATANADNTIPVTSRYTEEEEEGEKEEETEEDGEGEGEADKTTASPLPAAPVQPYFYPATQKQASVDPYLEIYQTLTNFFPGQGDWRPIIDAMRQLERTRPRSELTAYLRPFMDAWRSRKRANGRPYSQTAPTWLIEWAVSGEIPAERSNGGSNGNGNGKLAAELEALRGNSNGNR